MWVVLGTTIGSYRITGKLSEGGMGVVYRAEHVLLGRPAAIKLILPVWSESREVVTRFFDEARVTSTLRHPGIVEIFDFGYHTDGRAYLVMELLGGEPLSRRLGRGRMDELTAISIVRSIAGALAAAHARNVVHRDLKPDNIFLIPDPDMPTGERPKILDFGIAKLADRGSTGWTSTGAVLGTPAYMSPEQCRGSGEVDARADLYSLGCILYEQLSGRLPFLAQGSGELIAAHLLLPPDPIQQHAPAISNALAALVTRLVAKHPDDRPASAADVATELASIAAGMGSATWRVATPTPMLPTIVATPTTLGGSVFTTTPPATRPRRWWLAVAAAVAASAAVALVAVGRGEPTPATRDATLATQPIPVDAGAPLAVIDAAPLAGVDAVVVDAPVDAVPKSPDRPETQRPRRRNERDNRRPAPDAPLIDELPPPVSPLIEDLPPPASPPPTR